MDIVYGVIGIANDVVSSGGEVVGGLTGTCLLTMDDFPEVCMYLYVRSTANKNLPTILIVCTVVSGIPSIP